MAAERSKIMGLAKGGFNGRWPRIQAVNFTNSRQLGARSFAGLHLYWRACSATLIAKVRVRHFRHTQAAQHKGSCRRPHAVPL